MFIRTVFVCALAVCALAIFAPVNAYAAGCCENQTPVNGQGAGDDFTSGALSSPGCTNEPAASPNCFRFNKLQQFWNNSTCTGVDPDGAGPATGSTCTANSACIGVGNPAPCCTGLGTGNCAVTSSELTVPALSTWGILLFLVLASGLIVLRRYRSGMSSV